MTGRTSPGLRFVEGIGEMDIKDHHTGNLEKSGLPQRIQTAPRKKKQRESNCMDNKQKSRHNGQQ